jgi:protein-S-isoprenylcysteine O-methyltransferase Ste14
MNKHIQAGQVEDLVEKYHQKKINKEKILEVLKSRKLTERDIGKGWGFGYILWGFFVALPSIADVTKWDFLNWFSQLQRFYFPNWAVYLALAMFVLAIPTTVVLMNQNIQYGGVHSEDETILLMQEGIYGIIRHPGNLSSSIFFSTIPILLSPYMPFTFLSIIAIIFIIVLHYYACCKEERVLDIKKWGDQYREYMQRVPRWNFILGFWRYFQRKSDQRKK